MSHARPRGRITLIALTVVLALVLTSCFGGDEPETATTTTQQPPAPPPPAEPTPTTPAVVVDQTTTTTGVVIVPPPEEPAVSEVPPPPPPSDPPIDDNGILLYTVQAGDTLFSIAQRFGVSLDDVIEANNISNPDVIFEGDTLTIPPAG